MQQPFGSGGTDVSRALDPPGAAVSLADRSLRPGAIAWFEVLLARGLARRHYRDRLSSLRGSIGKHDLNGQVFLPRGDDHRRLVLALAELKLGQLPHFLGKI